MHCKLLTRQKYHDVNKHLFSDLNCVHISSCTFATVSVPLLFLFYGFQCSASVYYIHATVKKEQRKLFSASA